MTDDALFPEPLRPDPVAPTRLAEPAHAPERPLYAGHPALSAQVEKLAHIERVAQVCRDTRIGAVLTVGSRNSNPAEAVRELTAMFRAVTGDTTNVLVDANRYSGRNRIVGAYSFDSQFVRAQLDAGAAFGLAPSPYIPNGDHAGLKSVLSQTAQMKMPAVAPLPLGNGWFTSMREAKFLRETASKFGVPIAPIIEHRGDPFGNLKILRGALEVVTADVPVLQLRGDLSVLGLVAHGGAGGAIGTTTALRHLYPTPTDDEDGGGWRPARVGVWVPRLLGFHAVDTLGDVAQFDEVANYLLCDYSCCNGQGVERITNEVEAFDHSLRAIAQFSEPFFAAGTSLDSLCAAWHARCGSAEFGYIDIQETTAAPLTMPAFIGKWVGAHPKS